MTVFSAVLWSDFGMKGNMEIKTACFPSITVVSSQYTYPDITGIAGCETKSLEDKWWNQYHDKWGYEK